MNIAALCWALVTCLCIWPPVSTLLPRIETEQGWRIQWEAIFHLSSSRTVAEEVPIEAIVPPMAIPFAHADLAEAKFAQDSESGTTTSDTTRSSENSVSMISSFYQCGSDNGLVEPPNITQAPWPRASLETHHRLSNIGRVAAPLRTAASLEASTLFTSTVLPERGAHTTQACRQPSMIALSPNGDLGPAPDGALPFYNLQQDKYMNHIRLSSEQATSFAFPAPAVSPTDYGRDFFNDAIGSSFYSSSSAHPHERAAPAWLEPTIQEETVPEESISNSSPFGDATHELSLITPTDTLSTDVMTEEPVESSDSYCAPETVELESALERAAIMDGSAAADLAVLVALTGDTTALQKLAPTPEQIIQRGIEGSGSGNSSRMSLEMGSPGRRRMSLDIAGGRGGHCRVSFEASPAGGHGKVSLDRGTNGRFSFEASPFGRFYRPSIDGRPSGEIQRPSLDRSTFGTVSHSPSHDGGAVGGRPRASLDAYTQRRVSMEQFNAVTPFMQGAMPMMPPITRFRKSGEQKEPERDETTIRLDSLVDGESLLGPDEAAAVQNALFSPFAAESQGWESLQDSKPFVRDVTPGSFSPGHALETAPSAAQQRMRAVSHHLLDIAATLSLNASLALRSGSVMVVPVMPASVFEHCIASTPCFESSPPAPGSLTYVMISALILMGLVSSALVEHFVVK